MNRQAEKLYVKELIKMKKQESTIEKSLEYCFNNMKIDPNVMHECKLLMDKRNKEKNTLRTIAIEVDSGFDIIKSIINQLRNGEKIDTGNCQKKMKELLEKIDEFNVDSELELLIKQQVELDDFLNEFKINLSKYTNAKNSATKTCKISMSISENHENDHDSENYDEIKDFHSLIVKTGHTQHWKEKDHLYFLNVRKKCSNIPALVHEIQRRCPDLTTEKIVNHEAWYKIYLNLREKQRTSVNEWRKRKELEKKKKMEMIKNNEINKNKFETNDIKHLELMNDEKFYVNMDKTLKVNSSDKKIDEQKKSIKQWKIQKENTRIMEKERLKYESDTNRTWREKKFLERAIEIRDAVTKYKQEKVKNKLKSSAIINMKNDEIIKSPALIKSLRKKDEDFLKKRKELIEIKYRKSMKNNFNNIIIDNCPRSIDQSTLMKPTKIWNEKCKRENSSKITFKSNMYIKDLPKLSLNNWRNQTSLSFI